MTRQSTTGPQVGVTTTHRHSGHKERKKITNLVLFGIGMPLSRQHSSKLACFRLCAPRWQWRHCHREQHRKTMTRCKLQTSVLHGTNSVCFSSKMLVQWAHSVQFEFGDSSQKGAPGTTAKSRILSAKLLATEKLNACYAWLDTAKCASLRLPRPGRSLRLGDELDASAQSATQCGTGRC